MELYSREVELHITYYNNKIGGKIDNNEPQSTVMTDGRPESPVDNGATAVPPDNSHPDWHFGN